MSGIMWCVFKGVFVSKLSNLILGGLVGVGFTFSFAVHASESMQPYSEAWQKFNADPSLLHYVALQAQYELVKQNADVPEGLRSLAAQQQAMADTLMGRYEYSQVRLAEVYPSYRSPKDCDVEGYTPIEARQVVLNESQKHHTVLINESHTRVGSRAFFYSLLGDLKQQGFTHLALENLALENNKIKDDELLARGYPKATLSNGLYIAEPVMAEIVREAIRLGFVLVGYDVTAKSKEEREWTQAENLAHVLASNEAARLVVLAGHDHVHKTGGWMAQRLQELTNKPVYSINQASTMTGCIGVDFAPKNVPYVLSKSDVGHWSINLGATDLSVVHQIQVDETTGRPTWLVMNGLRRAVQVDKAACKNQFPCLISAYYKHEENQGVAADRVYLAYETSAAWLYLKPSNYSIHFQTLGEVNERSELAVGDTVNVSTN
ncbi:hypothetical protein PALB_13200 [Pseudoalteromonas luteoviolacea B = ATCC 29581]|nr:hypothetical protein PALB_13200 [Pseudoalteromonas luteoviolacea B = ATCC 29581]